MKGESLSTTDPNISPVHPAHDAPDGWGERMADTSPPVPGRSEAAFPVPGGWVQIVVDTSFTPASETMAPRASLAAADFVRGLDPLAIREAIDARLDTFATDPYAVALEVIAELLEGP